MQKSGCEKLSQNALKIDAFGRPFEFMLPNGTRKYKTLSGSIFTVILALIVTLYTAYKLQLLLNNDNVLVMVTTEDSFFDKNGERSTLSRSEHGFNLAFVLLNVENW